MNTGYRQTSYGGSSGAGAPVQATFITQLPDGTLTGEEALSLLATGLMKSTTGTGVVSIAVANTDYAHPSATYVVKTATSAPPNSQVLASLTTGLVKVTTTTGVLSTAVGGTDYVVPTGVTGGQTIAGDTAASGNLTLKGTAHATLGTVIVAGAAFQISNTLNTATDHAYGESVVNGTAAGDPQYRYTIPGGTSWYAATDNSDNDFFEFGTGTTVGSNVIMLLDPGGAVGIGVNPPSTKLHVSGSVTSSVSIRCDNLNNSTATSQARLHALTGGSSGGDPVFLLTISGVLDYYCGLDNSAADLFCIGTGSTVGTTRHFEIDTASGNTGLGGAAASTTSTAVAMSASRTVASATSAVWNGINCLASTLTLSGNTAITTQTGVNYVVVTAPTLSAGSALTVTHAASFYVSGVPVAAGAGPATITNAWAARFDGKTLFGGAAYETPIVTTAPIQLFGAGNTFIITRDSTNHVEVAIGNAGALGYIGTQTNHPLSLCANNSAKITITTGGLVGISASTPASRLEVVADSDTTNGAPSSYDGKFFTVGAGGATGGAVMISYNQSTNIGYIAALTPGTAYRVLTFNNGALSCSAGTQNVGVGVSASTTSTVLNVGGGRTVASATSAIYDGITLSGALTLTGTTAVTTATGVNLVNIPAPAYNDASAVTVTHAATVYIAGAPVAGGAGPVTITNAYALWIDSGKFRYDGGVALGGGAAPTFGTIGGSGPTTAAQNQWVPINVDGNARFFPVWA